MPNTVQIFASVVWVVAGALCTILPGILIGRRVRRRKPRTLVSQVSIPIGDLVAVAPHGLWVIDGVKTREGDIVVLARQNAEATNGVWLASKGTWKRPSFLAPNAIGSWRMITDGSQANTLWAICPRTLPVWDRVDPSSQLLLADSPDFAPNDPVEAAAYLLRNGVNPSQIRGTRHTCIENLIADRFLIRAQGYLLLSKPENLTTEISDGSGLLVRLAEQSWSAQVAAHMNSIQSTYHRLMFGEGYEDRVRASLQTPLTTVPLVGFSRIVKDPPEPPPRRSRYDREPVI